MAYDFGPSPEVKILNIENFRGVDFANNPTQVAKNRSPDARNIISDLAGKPVKRNGYETLETFDGQINGIFRLKTDDVEFILVHAGTKLYWRYANGTKYNVLYNDMNDIRSTAFQNNGRLYILDGKNYLCFGEFDGSYAVKKVSDVATVPVAIENKNPDGSGGSQRQDLNVLTSKRTYTFYVSAENTDGIKDFHLSADDSQKIDSKAVTARKLNDAGDWVDMVETTDFTVDRDKGIITFKTAIMPSPVLGVSNLEITFSAEMEYTADLINKCTIAALYGLNGATDRVFVAGNPDAVNFHYWSEIDDPCYFAGLNYAYLGQDSSAIMGYSRVGNALAVHKEDNDQDHTIFLVTGSYNESSQKTNFAISGSAAGIGAISKHCFCNLGTEPMFLASQGVYALTTQYLTAERYAQNRSYYIDPRLTKEENLSEAVAIEYKDYYYLAVNGHVYVADGRQKNYEKNAPQSEFQYEWYYLTDIDARVWWEYDGALYFGTADGAIKRFKTEGQGLFNDDGEPIYSHWKTPVFPMDTITRNKTLKNLHLMLAPYDRSSAAIYYRVNGSKIPVKVKTATTDIFSFHDVDFRRFAFNCDEFPMVVATNSKAKKFMHIQVILENNELNEGFGFYEIEFSYILVGKYKG